MTCLERTAPRRAQSAGISTDDIATKLDVDPKTVERWVTQGRVPYRKHRNRVAALLHETERYLWPEALDRQGAAAVDESELVKLYAHRNDIPHELWSRLLNSAPRGSTSSSTSGCS